MPHCARRYSRLALCPCVLALILLAALPSGARSADGAPGGAQRATIDTVAARARLAHQHPAARTFEEQGAVKRVYGTALTRGISPEQAAERFATAHAAVFGADAADLDPRGPGADQGHVQPLMYDAATGRYKFTLVYYSQRRGGIAVFRSDLRLLVRNEDGFPLVLAASSLRDLGDFEVPAVNVDPEIGRPQMIAAVPQLARFGAPQPVIWAGIDAQAAAPRLAAQIVAVAPGVDKYLFVVDAANGQILYQEQLLKDVDVVGNVSGLVTQGPGAEQCEAEVETPLPYVQARIGATSVFTDINGDFEIPNAGTAAVTVESPLTGQWFRVFNWAGADTVLSQNVTPPGPADFLHNAANVQFTRAEVNGYVHANVVRDRVIEANPLYPTLMNLEFPVWVNRTDGFCPGNAWYDPAEQSINFCQSNGANPNTAWTSVIYHEYGHHLVQVAGSGQGQYGEGTGDVMSVIILDTPELGLGFTGSCDPADSLRTADNTLQYPCEGAIHTCGQLISGCVWDTRNELIITEPVDYLDILGDLAINAILLHTGSTIAPDITIDWLTLDDNDTNLNNGTPHYPEICTGFGLHNMDCPPLAAIAFEYPSGLPATVLPDVPTVIPVNVVPVAGTPVAGSGTVSYRIGGGAFTTVPMNELLPNTYQATLPAVTCGDVIEFYFSASASGVGTLDDPSDAPASSFAALSTQSLATVVDYDFESNPGWTVTNDPGLADGPWDRGVPAGGGDRGDPPTDFDGSGQCWLTDNVDGNSDVDDGATTLTTQAIDLSGAIDPRVRYARWYSNTFGAAPEADVFEVEISNNNGASWVDLETVGPSGPEVDGGWFDVSFRIADYVTPGTQTRLRFRASDLGSGSVVEAAVDAFSIIDIVCAPCEEPCDDGNPCTLDDGCIGTSCVGTPVDCSAFSDQCSIASCDTGGALGNCDLSTPVANGTPCDDGDPCNVNESCQAGACSGGGPPGCGLLGDQCNTASCDPGGAEGNCDIITPAANGTPCDDAAACNSGESCQAGVCSGGSATDCSALGDDCNTASCDAGGAEDNCDLLTPANDGAPCNGGSGVCAAGNCIETRVFMARDGQQGAALLDGRTQVVLPQGVTATLMVWLQDTSPAGDVLNGYQLILGDTAAPLAGATGSVTYLDNDPGIAGGDSVFVDTTRPDWVFAGEPVLPVIYNETPSQGIFGALYTTLQGTGVDPTGGMHYLAQFTVQASPDALGDFELQFNRPPAAPPLSGLFNPTGGVFDTDLFQPVRLTVVELSCDTIADCADLDDDGIRDDNCTWWACDSGACLPTAVPFADLGGAFGACPPDLTADNNDVFHVLNCFSDSDTLGNPLSYPCEDAPPAAVNVDAAGLSSPCAPDGVCDSNDTFAVLNAFAGATTCSCPGGPAPALAPPATAARAAMQLVARRPAYAAGDLIEVDVLLSGPLADLRGYQVHLGVRGGHRGSLELVDIAVHDRKDRALAEAGIWQAYNTATAQMMAGYYDSGTPAPARAYLATFTYLASSDARGTFTLEVLHGANGGRTVLFATPEGEKIDIERADPALIRIEQHSTADHHRVPVARRSPAPFPTSWVNPWQVSAGHPRTVLLTYRAVPANLRPATTFAGGHVGLPTHQHASVLPDLQPGLEFTSLDRAPGGAKHSRGEARGDERDRRRQRITTSNHGRGVPPAHPDERTA